MMTDNRTLRIPGLAFAAVLLAGCAVGRDFRPPPAPAASGYLATALPGRTASAPVALGDAQHFAPAAPIDAQWWREFGSAKLDALIDEALKASPTLEAAQATLRQARETFDARAGATQYPQASGRLGAQRQRTNGAALGQSGAGRTFELYNASVAVSYDLDLAGGNRRALEALAAQVDHQRFQLEAARLALAGNLATAAITQAQLAAQLAASEAIVDAQQEQVEITRQRVSLGAAARDELLALQAQLGQSRAANSDLHKRLDQAGHLLAVLAGRSPDRADLPHFALAEFGLPRELPLRLPAELARRRPDIRASEALLHAADAQHGAALAKLYPQITLSATTGAQALTAAGLFGGGALIWGLAGQVAQPLFAPGLPAEARAAEAGFDAAAANYRQTVLQALRNVADVLRALGHDAATLAAQAAADVSASEALATVGTRHALGAASYLQWLTAQQQAQQARLGLVAAQAQRLADTVALYQAMGGGWADR
ncbi:MAG: efflux transporter outer membrane subunit [Burkholderiaceae bacterium]|nr:efflux transporter outer membrane subunit [Burkholderiaceae bacterium]